MITNCHPAGAGMAVDDGRGASDQPMKEIDTHTDSANSPQLGHSLWQATRLFFNRLMAALATLVIGVLLQVTIYFTLLDWPAQYL